MQPLGIIGGSAFLRGVDLRELDPEIRLEEVNTPRGIVRLHRATDFVFLRRHGEGEYRPPHRLPHHAHVLALKQLGVEEVVALASTGALTPGIRPGDVVVPDDYFSRHPPPTFAGDEFLHIVPQLSASLRSRLLAVARDVLNSDRGGDLGEGIRAIGVGTLHIGGVYGETTGPRFETRAEVRALARDASLVGMTAASEATLCQEQGLRYAMLCIVDNWANGVGPEPLTLKAFQARQADNGELAGRILRGIVGNWRDHPR